MICPRCSMNYDDNMQYCPNCGNPSNVNNGYQQQNYQPNQAYAMPNYGPVNYQQPAAEQPVKVSKYVGWFIVGSFFGLISLIISIVFACSGSNKNRANFFRAMLIIWAIVIAICVVIIIAAAVFGFSSIVSADTSAFYSEFMKICLL